MAEAEAEVEVHGGHEHHEVHGHDGTAFGKTVALSVSMIGVILAVVTIGSHRAHTAAVIYRSEANDLWSEYQSKRIRGYIAGTVMKLVPVTTDPAKVQEVLVSFNSDVAKYQKEQKEIQDQANAKEEETKNEERRALLLDSSEGFFELGLVLSSVYFLARRKLLPYFGAVAAAVGAVFGVLGFLA
jgi:hypothetical protein